MPSLTWGEGEASISQCFFCKHRLPTGSTGLLICRSFGGAIPEEITGNRLDHRGPHEADNGLRFEPIEGEESAAGANYRLAFPPGGEAPHSSALRAAEYLKAKPQG